MKREVIGSGWLALGNRVSRRAIKANRASSTLQHGQHRFPLQIGIVAIIRWRAPIPGMPRRNQCDSAWPQTREMGPNLLQRDRPLLPVKVQHLGVIYPEVFGAIFLPPFPSRLDMSRKVYMGAHMRAHVNLFHPKVMLLNYRDSGELRSSHPCKDGHAFLE